MMSATKPSPSWSNVKCQYTSTPMAYREVNVKPPSRLLWEKETVEQKYNRESSPNFQNLRVDEIFDTYESPQYVDFLNLQDKGDSFFHKRIFASTPDKKSQNAKLPTTGDDVTLTNCFTNLSLSAVNHDLSQESCNNNNNQNVKESEEFVVFKAKTQVEKPKPDVRNTAKKPQKTIVKPFSFDLREKARQQHKQEHMNKILEQEKKAKEFRANPLPKFIKARATSDSTRLDSAQNKIINVPEKHVQKNTELWKKQPFLPHLSTKKLERPKTPPLRSLKRAQERKQFDETIKQKEKLREEMRKKELAIKKQQEQEEIARLRKETVHKAQPVPSYKPRLPTIEKRPLTDPFTPLVAKRRRRV